MKIDKNTTRSKNNANTLPVNNYNIFKIKKKYTFI